MDKNSLLGFGLLMALLIGYTFYSQQTEKVMRAQATADSLAKALKNPPAAAAIPAKADSVKAGIDSSIIKIQAAAVQTVLENKDIAITFNSNGASPVKALLKNFKTASGQPLYVFNDKQLFNLSYKGANGALVNTLNLSTVGAVNGKTLIYTLPNSATITYTLPDSGYMMDVKFAANNTLDKSQNISLDWNSIAPQTEYNAENEMQYNQLAYEEIKDGCDFHTIRDDKKIEFKDGLKYLSYKQHYFNTTFLADNANSFIASSASTKPTQDTSNTTVASLNANINIAAADNVNFKIFAGPNDYKLLKSYNRNLEEIIPLGYGLMSFVKYINKWLIMPIFNLLSKFITNYGLIILILTFIVRLLMAPITYKSYVSGAKMKILKPELDALRAKHGDDQQAFGVAQMSLFRSAGVSPLGGCLPALAQLPIFFALLSFFPNAIELRQKSFLWTKDLSNFDSIANIPNIPFYGDHISLWTILFVVTSLILAIYNMGMTSADNSNPALKYLPFIMPVMFLGIFNKLPAALTFYYFVSNVITILLQWVIQNYVINHDKLAAEMTANKSKTPKTSKLMERMAEMQKQNQERMAQQNAKGKK
jgi:YidC/Oxa1 family membrane protein insertase